MNRVEDSKAPLQPGRRGEREPDPSDPAEIDAWIDRTPFQAPAGGEFVVESVETFDQRPISGSDGEIDEIVDALGAALIRLAEETEDQRRTRIEFVQELSAAAGDEDPLTLRRFLFRQGEERPADDVC